MSIVFVGIDLAKNVFALHGVNELGKPVLIQPKVARASLMDATAQPTGRDATGCYSSYGSKASSPERVVTDLPQKCSPTLSSNSGEEHGRENIFFRPSATTTHADS